MIITTQFDSNLKHDAQYKAPHIISVNAFNEEGFKRFVDDLEKIRQAGQPFIPIHIDSYGGQVYSLMGMISLLRNAKEPIYTYSGSKAMSCGAILLSCGTRGHRYVGEMGTVMIHSVSTGTMGKVGDVEVSAEEARRLNDLLFETLSENAGKRAKFFKKFLKKKTDRDVFLTPKQTVDLGIADHVGVPKITTKVSQSFEIGV